VNILLLNWQDRENPQAGGAEIHLHEIFGRIAAAGHRVTMVVSGWRGAPREVELDGIRVLRVGGRHSYPLRVGSQVRRLEREERFDVAVEALNKVPLYAPLWVEAPVMLLVHHLFGATAFREASPPVALATWLSERPLGRVYRNVPAEAISRSTREDLIGRGLRPEAIRVIHPGVDLDRFIQSAGPRAASPTFLYLGRLRRYKGVQLLVRAVALLRDRGVRVDLRIAGRGSYERRLRALATRLRVADRVHFEGFVSEEAKPGLFGEAWANLFPSPKEGWGITNLEAGACGTPSIAADAPGLRETVVDGETGVLVEPGSAAAFAEAIAALSGDRARVEALGTAARRHAARFTWDAAARETLEHLRSVVAPPDPAAT
jgi:glycosyltransferase involved in cell wall biosynthesis